jgi:hypothetical protein
MSAGLACRRGVRQIDPLAILREVRKSGTLSLRTVAARLAYSEETVRHSIAALGMTEAVRRLLRLRRRSARRVAVANVGIAREQLSDEAAHVRPTRTARVA